ncbi:hypothetical protein L0222_22410 [bacterium]|nr:hypothetical protein [bacterium]
MSIASAILNGEFRQKIKIHPSSGDTMFERMPSRYSIANAIEFSGTSR